MKVGLITSVPLVHPWDQGDKNLAYQITRALPQVCFQALTTRKGPQPEEANLDSVPIYHKRRPSLLEKAQVFTWLYSLGSSPEVDLYHLLYQPLKTSSRLLKQIPAFKCRPTLHTVPATTSGHNLDPRLFFADRTVAVSRFGERVLRRLGLQKVLHIPVGIEVETWLRLPEEEAQLKEQLDLANKLVLLYPGHYSRGFGADVLVEALPAVLEQVPEVRLIMACRMRSKEDRRREQRMLHRLDQLRLTFAVRFYHTVDFMPQLIGSSDLVVLPLEDMHNKLDIPTTLIESLAAARPIVISDIAPMNELLIPADGNPSAEEVGIAVPPADPQELARAMIRLLKDDAGRREMGRRGQQLACRRYNIHQVAKQYEAVYMEMVR
jgi:glycosyltransferase involved in cell wall biosynthesis